MARIEPKDAVGKNILLKQYEPAKNEYDNFLQALKELNSNIDEDGREGYNEGCILKFLSKAFYDSSVHKDKKGDIDLVITTESKVRVILEAKKVDSTEFPKVDGNINVKALQETVYYYLQESIGKGNKSVSRIVITNGIEWFVFDSKDFERLFGKPLKKDFEDFTAGRLSIKNRDEFYLEFAKPAIEKVKDQLDYVYFNIQEQAKQIDLITVFKILSPYYLLKAPCATDSNVLNDKFYKELLHIIGLYENDKDENGKPKTKKTIERLPADKRESGSLLENAITQLSYKNPFNLFDRAIQLVIVWINRILFLKLLEAQLVKWHNGDKNYKFLTYENLSEYDDLKELFFGVIARRPANREPGLEKYKDIPYLNSSLFEQTEEMDISGLKDKVEITVYKNSVLKGEGGSKMNPLKYLLRFLDAYDFGAAESEDGLRKDSKTLINASVLGLIFEKINGYKDGSFYTPGAITQYMCRETIRRAVVQKFNEAMKWNCLTFDDLANKELEPAKANQIINSMHICDPAVGSGHFLVSALNELISIKSELQILYRNDGRRLKNAIRIENDELMIYDTDGELYSYNPVNKIDSDNHAVQQTLFEEKRTIIENCLFGVDINPNSVNICRLRLWIELLKNAYYYTDNNGNYTLETLPNIDINIKCGNSLVSRYDFDIDISKILKKSEIDTYKAKVRDYKETRDKNIKHELEETIAKLKDTFRDSIQQNSSDFKTYVNNKGMLVNLSSTQVLFERTEGEKAKIAKQKVALEKKIAEYEEKQKNSIYENALEWRFEFPETLDDEGNFMGFDVVIGNPPYIPSSDQNENVYLSKQREHLMSSLKFRTLCEKWDIYIPFIELGLEKLCAPNACFSMIIPYPYTNQKYAKLSRKMLTDDYLLYGLADFCGIKIFPDAAVENCIPFVQKAATENKTIIYKGGKDKKVHESFCVPHSHLIQNEKTLVWNLSKEKQDTTRFVGMHVLGDYCYISKGMALHSEEGLFVKDDLISLTKDEIHSKEYVEAKDIDRYIVKRIRFLEYNTDRCPKKLSRPTFQELYECNKIVINCLGGLNSTIGTKLYHNHSLYCAVLLKDLRGVNNRSIKDSVKKYCTMERSEMETLSETVDLRYLLGVMNSKYAPILLTIVRAGDYHIYPEHIRNIPIPSATTVQQQPIIDLVDQILAAKKQDAQADINELEKKIKEWEHRIDLLVYHLYGLTYDEAKMIDETITEEDFAAVE